MAREYIMRFEGGPHPGDRVANPDIIEWPPPDNYTDPEWPDGVYRKVSQSGLTYEQADHPNLMRAVRYVWQGVPVSESETTEIIWPT